LAFLKLRKRNLAPLLDANGWAVNTRAIINIPFGASLTHMAVLPPGAQSSLTDPYAEKKSPWKSYVFIVLLLSGIAYIWHSGYISRDAFDTLRKQFSTNHSATTESKAPSDTKNAATSQTEATSNESKPMLKGDSQSSAKAIESTSNTSPPAPAITIPAPKPVNR